MFFTRLSNKGFTFGALSSSYMKVIDYGGIQQKGSEKMGRIGSFDFPDMKFSRALEICKRICEAPYRGEISRAGLASDLEMKESGGAFSVVVASLKDFRLVEGRDALKVTDLGKRIFAGSSEDSEKAKSQSFLSVPLFQTLSQKLGHNLPDEAKFRVILGEISKEDPLKVKTISKSLMNSYSEGSQYVESLRDSVESGDTVISKVPFTSGTTPASPNFVEVRAGQYYQKLPYDTIGLKIAMDFLQSLATSIEQRAESRALTNSGQ